MKTLLLSLALLFALAGCASSNSGMSNFDTELYGHHDIDEGNTN